MKKTLRSIGKAIAVILVLCSIPFIFHYGCTRPALAMRVLSEQGYKNIDITGYRFFMCGKDDWFSTGFVAISPNGHGVSGCVCSGIFKGATIRFD